MSGTINTNPLKGFLWRAFEALVRLAVGMVFGGCHWLANRFVLVIAPENMKSAALWLDDITFVFFSLVYVYIGWDTLKVFIPWLQAHDYPGTEDHEE